MSVVASSTASSRRPAHVSASIVQPPEISAT
jgi:hypothetical protein